MTKEIKDIRYNIRMVLQTFLKADLKEACDTLFKYKIKSISFFLADRLYSLFN